MKKHIIFFAIGGTGYAVIELLWRGRTHWSMVIAGGICFITFSLIDKFFGKKPMAYKLLLCSLSITTIEFIFGVIFNIILKLNVWNYSDMPYNVLGQICPQFFLLWCGVSLLFLPVARFLNDRL